MAEKTVNDTQLNYLVNELIKKISSKADNKNTVKSVNNTKPDTTGNVNINLNNYYDKTYIDKAFTDTKKELSETITIEEIDAIFDTEVS